MDCQILRTLYVKANGTIPCEDNRGEWIKLGEVRDDPDWSIAEVLDNAKYAEIRDALRNGRMPWPETCSECALIRPHRGVHDRLAGKHIEKLQIETTLACALRCPGCSALGQMKLRPKPHVMPLGLFRRLLESLASNGYSVDFIEYCGQGEPLAHPEFASFVRLAREILPKARQRLVTNGNYSYAERIGDAVPDEIYVSADGFFQPSYEKYRVRGKVDQALAFLRDAASEGGPTKPLVVWKYILFDFNDSPEELGAAQDFAIAHGIDVLMFVLTRTEWKSHRWTPETYPEILLHAPNARLSLVPDFLREARHDKPIVGNRLRRKVGDNWAKVAEHIDTLWCHPGMITLRGWARPQIPGDHVAEVTLCGDGHSLGKARLGIHRPEVFAHFGQQGPRRAGFAGSFRWARGRRRPDLIELTVRTQLGHVSTSVWIPGEKIMQGP